MLKVSLLLQASRTNNSRILQIKNAKFLGYCFHVNTNIQGDFQICISVPLNIHLKNESNKINICFIDNSNINSRYNCYKRGIHLNKSRTNNLIENFLFVLGKFSYSHKIQVSMNSNIFSEISNSNRKKLGSTKIKNLFKTIKV